jgi:hypothetical protein
MTLQKREKLIVRLVQKYMYSNNPFRHFRTAIQLQKSTDIYKAQTGKDVVKKIYKTIYEQI